MTGDKSHIQLTLRSGGLHERKVYDLLVELIDEGVVERKDGRFHFAN